MLNFFQKFLSTIVFIQLAADAIEIKPELVPSLIKQTLLKNVRKLLQTHVRAQEDAHSGRENTAPSGLISNDFFKLFDNSITFEDLLILKEHLQLLDEIEEKFEQKILPENVNKFVDSIKFIIPRLLTYEVRAEDGQTMLAGEKRAFELEIEICGNLNKNLGTILEELKNKIEKQIEIETIFKYLKKEAGFLSKVPHFREK
ncbi:hypothetical protein GPALN_010180 [Globodera pallida]|nr:hypothetical protein GPALN_010180 [Globodera pallida]